MNEDRGPWYLLTGIIIGFVIGFVLTKIYPVEFVDTSPNMLSPQYKSEYRALIAAAFSARGNLERAQARLNLLGDDNSASELTLQAQQSLAEGRPESEAKALSLLAVALSQGSISGVALPVSPTRTPTEVPTPTGTTPPSDTPAPSNTPVVATLVRSPGATITPLPSRTPTSTPGAPFVQQDEPVLVCEPDRPGPLLMVETYDASGGQVPGVEIIVTWTGGEEHFFTGLKPELGIGYADFKMTPGTTYAVHTEGGGENIPGILPAECEESNGDRYWGSWLVTYVQP